jgi:hypothetical protein
LSKSSDTNAQKGRSDSRSASKGWLPNRHPPLPATLKNALKAFSSSHLATNFKLAKIPAEEPNVKRIEDWKKREAAGDLGAKKLLRQCIARSPEMLSDLAKNPRKRSHLERTVVGDGYVMFARLLRC